MFGSDAQTPDVAIKQKSADHATGKAIKQSRGKERPRLFTSTHPEEGLESPSWEEVRSEPAPSEKSEVEIYQ
jgi:hypothetical protein